MSRTTWTNEKLFFRLLNNKSDKTYWENIRVLRSRGTRDIFDKCVSLTKSEIAKERTIGIDILAQLGFSPRPFYEETINLFFELLAEEKKPDVLASLLYAVGNNNDNLTLSQIEKLCTFKDNKNSSVRQGVVSSLLRIENQKAIATLIILSNDKISSIRDWATFGIGSQTNKNTKEIREVLWKRTNDKDDNTKMEAIVGLASRKDMRIKEIINQALLTGDFGGLMFNAIIELKYTECLPQLNILLKFSKEDGDINHGWITDLETCITQLEKIEVNKKKKGINIEQAKIERIG